MFDIVPTACFAIPRFSVAVGARRNCNIPEKFPAMTAPKWACSLARSSLGVAALCVGVLVARLFLSYRFNRKGHMKNSLSTLCSLGIVVLLFGCSHDSQQTLKNLADAKQSNEQLMAQVTSQASEIADLKANLDTKTAALSKANIFIAQAKSLIADYQKQSEQKQQAQAEAASREQLMAEVIAIRKGDAIVFPQLLSASGKVLMADAEFRKPFGRKVIFKNGDTLETFDVDELHPGVLLRLGIDASAAKANQVARDAAAARLKEALAAAGAANAQTRAATYARYAAEQEQAAKEQAIQDEANRRQQLIENQQQQTIDNDTMRAKAAMIDATRPW
jgi:hypothetical protein